MIDKLSGHINNNQINIICNRIISQYLDYLKFMESVDREKLFAEEYAPHRKQHQLSHAIVSAFRSGMTIAGFAVSCKKDNGGHSRPELHNSKLVMHIQSKGTDVHSRYLRQYYEKNRNNFSNEQIYCYLLFEERRNQLIKLTLCLPDENGVVVWKEVLEDQESIIQLVS